MKPSRLSLTALVLLPFVLGGCDLLGIEPASATAARKEAEGKAIGGACRHAGRAIEDCYTLNKKADKAAVFAGWREMNDYMRENKIEVVKPEVIVPPPAPKPPADGAEEEAETHAEDKVKEGKDKAKDAESKPDKPASKAGAKSAPATKSGSKHGSAAG